MNVEPASYQSILNTGLIILGFIFTIFFLWKTKAVGVYKDAVEAYEVRLRQLEVTLSEIKCENKELHAQINQLIGENKTLSSVVAKPDDVFKQTVLSILEAIRAMKEEQGTILSEIIFNRECYVKAIEEIK